VLGFTLAATTLAATDMMDQCNAFVSIMFLTTAAMKVMGIPQAYVTLSKQITV
jgi:hypothetical protein